MKYFLILICMMMTACASTLPEMTHDQCVEQAQRIKEEQAQLKLRRVDVQKQLNMIVPTEGWHLLLPRRALVQEFNTQVERLETTIHIHNYQCKSKK